MDEAGSRHGNLQHGGGRAASVAQGPGPANAFGPTGPLGEEPIVVEAVSSGAPPSQPLSTQIAVLDMLRATLPLRALELSADNDAGWDELARYAYAAALNGDPMIASLGAHTLAWLASGLSLQAVRIAARGEGTETAAVPATVATAVGDPDARLAKTLGGIGRFLPLGRPSTFKKALVKRPELDASRANAARGAVARLATVKVEELVRLAVPALLDRTAPVDPPAPLPMPDAAPTIVPSAVAAASSAARAALEVAATGGVRRSRKRRTPRGLWLGALAAAAALWLAWRESREEGEGV